MKILITILRHARSNGAQIRRRSNSITIPVISFMKMFIRFVILMMNIVRSIRILSCFQTIYKNSKCRDYNCSFYAWDTTSNKNRKCQRTNSKSQQMSPNERSQFFNMFFLNDINVKPRCFKVIKGRKNNQQNRRIEERYLFISVENLRTNAKNQNRQQVTPRKISYFLQRFNHGQFSNSLCLYYNTKKVKSL